MFTLLMYTLVDSKLMCVLIKHQNYRYKDTNASQWTL